MPRKKSFLSFLTEEDHLHNGCCRYLTYQYRDVFFFHVPNEGKRSAFERFKAAFLFIQSGVPDLFICRANKRYHGLAVEFKTKHGTLSPEQKIYLTKLDNEGWMTHVIRDVEVFKKVVDEYLSQK